MSYQTILTEQDGSRLDITLNRPDQRNAINDRMIYELTAAFSQATNNPEIRVICLSGAGKSFCSGADITWMQAMAQRTEKQNKADAQTLAELLHTLFVCPIPIVGCAQGHVYGGGLGLLAVCDSVIATHDTNFCLSEVKIGLIPATIYPYVLRKIGLSQTTHLSLSASVFVAEEALGMGLIHAMSSESALKETSLAFSHRIQKNSPAACRAAKSLIRDLHPVESKTRQLTGERLAAIRCSPEGKEGLHAFLDKRQPNWNKKEAL